MKKKSLFEKQKFTFKRKCYKKNCLNPGIYKAPKSKDEIKNYIWFCEEHIKSYNKEWNYCKNMTQKEIENHIQLDAIGWRPTWNFSTSKKIFQNFEKLFSDYLYFFKKKKYKLRINKNNSLWIMEATGSFDYPYETKYLDPVIMIIPAMKIHFLFIRE